MKNINQFLVLFSLVLSGVVNAQVLVWENTFDTPQERAGWVFYDGNNNNNTWNVGKHVVRQAATPNMYVEVSPDYVLRHSAYKPNVIGGPANFQDGYINDFEDWVISPEIDLTGASGTITLAAMIGKVSVYSTTSASNDTYRHVLVYVSTPAKPIPSVADFQTLRTDITTAHNNGSNSVVPKLLSVTNADYIAAGNALFAQATADLSQYAGQKIYIGFWHNVNYANNSAAISTLPFKDTNSSNTFQIDEMQVYADSNILSTSDAKVKSTVMVYPNPVTDVLYLKGISKANMVVYNAAGQQVLNQVGNGQLNVSSLPKGVYTLTVDTDGKKSTTKFIKK